MNEQIIVPSRERDYVELARTKTGKAFRKHILNRGDLIHPTTGEKISIDDDFIAKLKTNFTNKVCDIVQVPLAGPKNEHSEAPDRNIGEVTDIQEENGKVYAVIDARKHADDLGSTLLGASAMMHLDYTDTSTGEKVGPTLLHVAVTNRPYVTGLENYEELVAASVEGTGEATVLLSAAPEEGINMDLDQILALLKDKHDIDVPALQTAAAAKAETAQLSAAADKLAAAGLLQLSNGHEVKADDIVSGISKLVEDNTALANRVNTMELSAKEAEATSTVEKLVGEGKIAPAKAEKFTELFLSNRELFDALVPDEPLVALSVESGYTPADTQPDADIQAAISRYKDMAA